MSLIDKEKFLFKDLKSIKGVGFQISKYLKKKKIEKIIDLLWNFPYDNVDRSIQEKIANLREGKIYTIIVKVIKYNFPRVRNLPNKILCEDDTGKLEIIYFNSKEFYLKKMFPLNSYVFVSGKISSYKNKFQIINPDYVGKKENLKQIKKIIPKYSLTQGINEKKYKNIIKNVLDNTPEQKEWFESSFIKKYNLLSWKKSIESLHLNENKSQIKKSIERLAYDEIFAHLISLKDNRQKVKRVKKREKVFQSNNKKKIIQNFNHNLTNDQLNALKEIEDDLKSKKKMFRIIQGDVGSGKTIVSVIASSQVIESGYQVAFMAPTEILAKQHFNLYKEIFEEDFKAEILTGKTLYKKRQDILKKLENNEIKIIFGTHALFQKKIKFKKLGLIIVDEQHKFGVNQRKKLSEKGGTNCDVLVMSATPIPRTMMMTLYGDMDITLIKSKPKNRKEIKTYTKNINRINDVISFIKKEIDINNQIFWVCPLIEESKKIDHQSSIVRYEYLAKIFKDKVGLIHGSIEKDSKEKILDDFLKKKIKILVSTTVIEVGIDFPNATCIIIEDSNKFGLSQLHQLRGRVGRGSKQSTCILIFKSSLSENARKRLKILKSSNDGFLIAEEDLKLRGYGDLLGFQQSGEKTFRLADPIINEDLFKLAEKEIEIIEKENTNLSKYNLLLKLYDRANIVNELV